MRISTAFLFVILGSAAQAFSGATISQRLEEALNTAINEGSMVRTLVLLNQQVDIPALDKALSAPRATAQKRASTVITSLQSLARETQASLTGYLQTRSPVEVRQYQSFWVVNMLLVEATPEVILEIAGRGDVALLDLDAELAWDRPVDQSPAPYAVPNGTEPGVRAIKAHKMWDLGYTGAGRIVMNIDTGVNVNHPAINYKWRGNHVPADQAWFDPINGTTTPNDCDGHGTHTMGTMTGLDSAFNDTIGVAPGAEWIAAKTICTSPHTSYSIAAFQWAMDPDGDPMTTDDMPAAIGNSWYDPSASDCANGVYRPTFDAVEAAGIAIVFSAGNNGPGGSTITVPKNTNTDLVNVFATGAIDGNNPSYPIAVFSSRGPSQCGGSGSLLIKPEACAPGVNVRSSYQSAYAFLSGTSMACPHVVGAIALLKEALPQFTGHELKLALYNTAVDLGTAGEENTYGMGIIDVYAAFLSFDIPNPPAGFTAYSDYTTPTSISLVWEDPVNLANGDTLLPGDYTLYLLRDGVLIDSLEADIEQYLDEGLQEGQEYAYEMYTKIDTAAQQSVLVSATWVAGGALEPAAPQDFTLSGNQDEITLFWTNPATNADGTPMIDFGGINLYQDGLLVSTFSRAAQDTGSADSATYAPVVPDIYNWHLTAVDSDAPQNESEPTASLATPLNLPVSEPFATEGEPNPGIWRTVNADVNTRASNPPSGPYSLNLNGQPAGGDTVEMHAIDLSGFGGSGAVFAYYYQPQGTGNAPETGDSLTLWFKNDLGNWIIVRQYPGRGVQPFQQEIVDIAAAPSGGGTYFHGQFQLRFTNRGSSGTIPNDDWFVDNVFLGIPAPSIVLSRTSVEFDTTEVGSSSMETIDLFNTGTEDLVVSDIVSSDPAVFSADTSSFTVAPGEAMTISLSFSPNQAGLLTGTLAIASNDPAVDTLMIELSGVGEGVTSVESTPGLPDEFSVSPNFPNPFNPATTIKYQLPLASKVELAVYSLLGGRVKTLVDRSQEAGYYEARWDGTNDAGIPVTSGVYIYRFAADRYQMVRKMILLK